LRLVSFDGGFGRVDGETVIPMGPDLVRWLVTGEVDEGAPVALSAVRLRPPVPAPGKLIFFGLNYADHAAESGVPLPEVPTFFAKWNNSLVAHGETIVVPPATEQPDYEAELGVVIGRRARDVDPADALSYVAGYTCVNDVSARDLQLRTPQWTHGKAIDTFAPMGPWLVTADEVPDPQRLGIRCEINGELLQDSNTKEMAFGVAELVSFLSRTMTLEPGDVLGTGTPPGVGSGRTPQRWLRDGDRVAIEIDGVGRLENPVSLARPTAP
jgi:2-keto-4-pentenoate hydratase/2-oxohepta-3-ene-1,7-dioic acid hydratase in catechol pathway